MSQWSDECSTIANFRTIKARKEHKCHACNERIAPGETYQCDSFLFEGEWNTVKRCARCELMYRHLDGRMREERDWDTYCDSELKCGHEYEEEWGEPPPEDVAALAFMTPEEAQAQLGKEPRK